MKLLRLLILLGAAIWSQATGGTLEVPVLSSLEAGPRADKGLFEEPWEGWLKQPIVPPMLVEAEVKGGASVVVQIDGESFSLAAGGCGTPAISRFYPGLRPFVPFKAVVSGANWNSVTFNFKAYVPRSVQPQRGPNSVPRAYQVFVNGEEIPDRDALVIQPGGPGGMCGNYSVELTIEVRPDRGFRPAYLGAYEEHWSRDEEQDAGIPGDGQWLELGPGRSTNALHTGFRWAVSVGKLINGMSAGKIRLVEDRIGADLFNGASLSYTARTTNRADAHAITSNGVLRQIRTLQALVDVQSTSSPTEQCVLRFHPLSNVGATTNGSGLYPIDTNSPFVTWIIRNPNSPGVYSKLQVIEERPGSRSYTCDLSFEAGNVWRLSYGSGGGQRIETRVVSITDGVSRRETIEIGPASGTMVYKAVEDYHKFAWGWELTNVVTNPGGNALTTSFKFHTDANEQRSYGKLAEKWSPGGRWELSAYPYYVGNEPVAAGWPIGDFADLPLYPEGVYPTAVTKIRPWLDGPATAGGANATNVLFSEYNRNPLAVSSHLAETRTDVRLIDSGSGPTRFIVSQDEIRDGDYQGSTNLTRQDYRWRKQEAALHYEAYWTRRFQAEGHWLHDLVRYQCVPTLQADLYEYTPGTLSGTAWTTDTNGLGFRKIKTSGLDLAEPHGFGLQQAAYWDSAPLDSVAPTISITCVESKSTQEICYLKAGRIEYQEAYAMAGVSGGGAPTWRKIDSRRFYYDSLGHLTNITWTDVVQAGISRVLYEAGWKDASGNDTELKAFEILETGERTNFAYDSQKRLASVTLVGVGTSGAYAAAPDITTNYVYNAAGWLTETSITDGTLNLSERRAYDLSGRPIHLVGFDSTWTTMAYASDALSTTEAYSGGLTKVSSWYLDGRLKSVTGSVVVAEYHDYWTDTSQTNLSGNYALTAERVYLGSGNSPRWREYARHAGCALREFREPEFGTTNVLATKLSYTGPEAVLDSISAPRCVIGGTVQSALESFNYNQYGALEPYSETEAYGSAGRSSRADSIYEYDGTNSWRVYRRVEMTAGGWRTNLSSLRLTGYTSTNTLADGASVDFRGNRTDIQLTLDKPNKSVTAVTNTPQSGIDIVSVTRNGLLQSVTTGSIATPGYFYYDGLRRQIAEKSPLGVVTGVRFSSANGWRLAETNAGGRVFQTAYYATNEANAGMPKSVTAPNLGTTYFAYNSRGQQTRRWGGVPYPEELGYDAAYGDLTQRRAFRGGSGWTGASWPAGSTGAADVTTTSYDPATGLPVSKLDNSGKGYTYHYDVAHSLAQRIDARGVSTTCTWTPFGEILSKSYSDGTSGFSVNSYTPQGEPDQVSEDAAGTLHHAYREEGELWAVSRVGGPLHDVNVTNRIDRIHGRDSVEVLDQWGVQAIRQFYGFDSATARLNSVTSGAHTAEYSYLPNSDLVATTTFKTGGTTRLTTSRAWDRGYRLRSIANAASGGAAGSHLYHYDELDRRRVATLQDSSSWHFGYNDRSELSSGRRFWGDFSPVAGQQYEYAYDTAGNRTMARSGGDLAGAGLRQTGYTPTALNQYSAASNPGFSQVAGAAMAPAAVTVNGAAADRKGEFYHREVPVSNGGGPAILPVSAVATLAGSSVTNSGVLLVPPASQSFLYDANGSLTNDGVWVYLWDGENRLKEVANTTSVASSQRKRLQFAYDYLGRRLWKKVIPWSAGLNDWGSATNYTLYLYDGWNVIAELDGLQPLDPLPLVRSHAWGLDLAGSLGEAGGVGGLVLSTDHRAGTDYYPACDGNGNVTALVKSDGTIAAVYEYAPFGELIRATGAGAYASPFLFSTKYYDCETSLSYYGHRYYSAALGRWLNEDPIEEDGGPNLYAFVGNDPINAFDLLGTMTSAEQGTAGEISGSVSSSGSSQATTFLRNFRQWGDEFNELQQIASDAMDVLDGGDDLLIAVLEASNQNAAKARGGDSAAARLGRAAHKLYDPGEGYRLNQAIPGSKGKLRPDAVDFVRGIVRELKPFSKSGIRQGRVQIKKYLNYLNENFKREGGWKGFIDYY